MAKSKSNLDNDMSPSLLMFDEEDSTIDEDHIPSQESIVRKDLFDTPMKLTRESVDHNKEPIKVYLRIRPFTGTEIQDGESQDCMEVANNSSCLLMHAPRESFNFKNIARVGGTLTHKYTFSNISHEDTSQKRFFDDTMLGTVKDFVDGQNCLVFTYGVTNAGKTHTIQGTAQDGGILPRSLDVLFNSTEGKLFPSMRIKPKLFADVVMLNDTQIQQEELTKAALLRSTSLDKGDDSNISESDSSKLSQSSINENSRLSQNSLLVSGDCSTTMDETKDVVNILNDINLRIPDDTSVDVESQGPVKFSIWVSFIEIYNEYIYDLLEPMPKGKKARRQTMKLAEDKNGNVYIRGMKEVMVNSSDEAYKILKIGQKNLSIASTKLNHCSSRSHCVFSVKVLRVVDVAKPHVARVSTLSFCDLAGSERSTKTQAVGDRMKEAANINTSLLTLGKCIKVLRYNQNHQDKGQKVIPFRESKLTRLFQSFFMGHGKASMIVNVNQCASMFDETMHVLKFSAIAKQVTTVTSKLENKLKLINEKTAIVRTPMPPRQTIGWANPEERGRSGSDDTIIEEDEDEGSDDEDNNKVKELLSVIDTLKQRLVEERQKQIVMESKIREEVCNEMAQQLVNIEAEYSMMNKQMQVMQEEKCDKRIEMYMQSVKKNRKRARVETEDDDEMVSSVLLHAEECKVKERDETIQSLNNLIASLQEQLKQEKDEMKESAESDSISSKTTDDSLLNKQISEMRQTILNQQSEVTELQETLNDAAEEFHSKTQEIEKLKAKIAEDFNTMDGQNQAIKVLEQVLKDCKAMLETTNEKLQERDGTIECMQQEMQELKQTLKTANGSLQNRDSEIENLKTDIQKLKESISTVSNKVEQPSPGKGDETCAFEVNEIMMKNECLEEKLKTTEAALVRKTTECNEKQENDQNISSLNEKIDQLIKEKDHIEVLYDDQKKLTEETEENLKKAEQQVVVFEQKMEKWEEKQQIMETMNASIEKLKDECEHYKKVLEKNLRDSETESNLKEQLADKKESQIQELKGKIEKLQKKKCDIENQNKEMKSMCKESLREAEKKYEERQKDLHEEERKTKELNDKIKLLLEEKEEYQKEVNELLKKERTLSEEIQELKEKMEKLEKEKGNIENQIKEMKSMYEKSLREAEKKYEERQKDLHEEERITKELNDKIKLLLEEKEEYQKEVNELLKKERTLNEEIQEFKEKREKLEKEKGDIENQNEKIKSMYEESLRKAEKKYEERQKDLQEKVNDKIKLLLEEKEGYKEKVSQLLKKERTLSEENDIINKLFADKEMEAEQSSNKAKTLKAENENLVSCQGTEVDQLNKKIQHLHSDNQKFKEQLKKIETEMKTLTEVKDGLDKMLLEKEKKEYETSKKLDNLSKENQRFEELLAEKHIEVDQLQEAIKERENCDEGVEKMVIQKENEICELKEGNQKLEVELLEIDKNVKKWSEDLQELQKILKDKEEETEKLNEKVRNIEKDNENLNNKLKNADNESKSKVESSLKEINELSSGNENLQEKIQALLEERKNDQKKMKLLTTEKRVAEDKLKSYTAQMDKISDRIMSFEDRSSEENKTESQTESKSSNDSEDLFAIKENTDNEDTSRIEMDVTPLQKRRKQRTNRRAKKRKSLDSDDDDFQPKAAKREQPRRTRRTAKKEEGENKVADGKVASPGAESISKSGRRAALTKLGDMFHNKAKKIVDVASSITTPQKSPPRVVEMRQTGTEKKKKRKLYKTDISSPFECNPHEVICHTAADKETDNSHGIVTRKLRSRQTKI
ncbi:uncharacterized protein [Antedon mediterranea]|uniref:uncharacterized protein isoform X2 n=1 Tax=Antedon mediterranea TaxID=105859 RepID=UPI003AF4C2C9